MNYQEILTSKDYKQLDDVQFKIVNVPGMEIVRGSIELDGELQVLVNNTALALANNVKWDGMVGIHNLIAFTSEKVNGRLLSDNLNYPRYVKMKRNATMLSTNVGSQSDTCRELCTPTDEMSKAVLIGNGGVAPFSVKPYFSVNESSRNLTYGDARTIEIDFRINDKSIFYGTKATVNQVTILVKNLRLRYITQPARKYNNPVIYPIVSYKIYDITSDKSSNDIITPIPTKWVMSSFGTKQDPASANLDPPLQLQNPNPTQIKYLYNDQNNVGVSFQMLSQEEMLLQYLHAVGDKEDNNIDLQNLTGKDSCFAVASTVGLLPPKTKISYQYDTDAGSTGTTYIVYTYFLGEIEM